MKRTIASDNILNHTNISVLERKIACLKYHHQLDQTDYNSNFAALFSDPFDGSMGPDPGWENGWSGFGFGSLEVNYGSAAEVKETPLISSDMCRAGNFKKKKLASVKGVGALKGEDGIEKKNKKRIRKFKEEDDEEEKSKITEENTGSTKSIKKKKKVTKEQQNSSNDSCKSDYIHVRARRGQATDRHSLAERVRRDKISERMKFLQDLVPGCNKITGKAGMLDEIINYVQSLQSQIEFLSIKLTVVNPSLDFEAIDDIFGKEVISDQTTDFTNVVMPSHDMVNSGYLQFNPMQQVVQSSRTETTINTFDSDPNGEARQTWDSEMHNLYSSLGFDQGRPQLTTFTNYQPFSGSMNTNNLKVEM